MAPLHTKNGKSLDFIEDSPSTRPQTIALKSPLRTPKRTPQKRLLGITEVQKQALIDNLQLEGTLPYDVYLYLC